MLSSLTALGALQLACHLTCMRTRTVQKMLAFSNSQHIILGADIRCHAMRQRLTPEQQLRIYGDPGSYTMNSVAVVWK